MIDGERIHKLVEFHIFDFYQMHHRLPQQLLMTPDVFKSFQDYIYELYLVKEAESTWQPKFHGHMATYNDLPVVKIDNKAGEQFIGVC